MSCFSRPEPELTEDEERAKSWADLKERLKTEPPKKTTYDLYWVDDEGDMVCRHCRASYNFGHFPGCLYDADWQTDRRTVELKKRLRALGDTAWPT